MSLSVCCMTNDPPERVARALAPLRAIADQIVVGVDGRVERDRLGVYDDVADEICRFTFRPPVDRPRAWLATRCRGEWILWVDGDEVLSPSLVAALPELILDAQLTQYWFTRRWLFPDTCHWIEENPWWPDLQVRLVRNNPFTMRFGRTHEPFGTSLPARHLDLPIYHLACLVSSVSERVEKAARYDAVAPGRVSPGGGPFNQVLCLPERYATLRPQLVPAGDREAIEHVLAARPRLAPSRLDIHDADDDAVDALSADRDLADDDYRARITVVDRDIRFAPGCPRSLLVRVQNDGGMTWPYGWNAWPQVRLSTHWHRLDGRVIVWDGERTPLPHPLPPGQDLLVAVNTTPPRATGVYRLTIDLVDEGRRWFDRGPTLTVLVADRWRRFDPQLNAARWDRTGYTTGR